jgi:5-formyltetrahydrofolate cyclo-ligase
VPGLAFDNRGFRLGRGAGHYDRLLPSLRSDAVCWALCLSCQVVEALPVEPHDAPLDGFSAPDKVAWGARRTITPLSASERSDREQRGDPRRPVRPG